MFELLKRDRRAQLFFSAHAQSAIGTGGGYVALLLVAYDRLPGAWGITLVLMADFLPAIVLGPIFGAAADRWSRRVCAVVADLARGVAFVGIALVGGIEATIALALLAGLGAGLFQPAILAGLPSLVDRKRVAPAMSLYGAISEMGTMMGPALAALLLLWVSPEALLAADGVTFLLSAAVLAVLPFGGRPEAEEGRASLLRDARDGLAAARRLPGVRTLIYASGAVLLFGGMLNVVELLFAKNELDAGDSAFSILIALAGLGIVVGSAIGSRGGSLADMRYRYLGGLLLLALGLLALAVTPVYAVACAVFVAIGVGNGLVLVHGRLLLQRVVPEGLLGRIFGIKDAVNSAAFSVSFLCAGLLVSLLGNRTLLAIAGAGGLVIWAVTSVSLRRMWPAGAEPAHEGAGGVEEPALQATTRRP
jgi:MFS family permease